MATGAAGGVPCTIPSAAFYAFGAARIGGGIDSGGNTDDGGRMRGVLIGCLGAVVLTVLGCADGRGMPSKVATPSDSATAGTRVRDGQEGERGIGLT